MAKGYSVRRAQNYTRNAKGEWKLHSMAMWDNKGYTMVFPTIEKAREAARLQMADRNSRCLANESGYIVYCKIYLGKKYIETVEA